MAKIFHVNNSEWVNYHENIRETVPQQTLIANNNYGKFYERIRDSAVAVMNILDQAVQNKRKININGGTWSMTKIGFSEDWNIDTTNLNLSMRLQDEDLEPNGSINSANLVYSQCGTSIKRLLKRLYNRKKSLPTCGASNGQTIVGAISTGTHGAGLSFGSIQEAVIGLHIITSSTNSIYLERSSSPIANDRFAQKIGATIQRDDDLFNAALVGLGSFGFIYGVVLQVEDLFVLRNYVKSIPFNDLEELLDNQLDFNSSNFKITKETGNSPYHFKVLINPYNKECKAEIMYKKAFYAGYKDPKNINPNLYNKDLLAVIGGLTQKIPISTKIFIKLLESEIFPNDQLEGLDGILGHQFFDTTTAGKTFSTAIGIPLNQSKLALNTLIDLINDEGPIPAILSMRFVKGTKALLGFTKYDDTAILEIDGIRNKNIVNFIKLIPDEFKSKGIGNFTFHWGKDNPLNKNLVKELYNTRYDRWLKKKKEFLSDAIREVFCNNYSFGLGLCGLADVQDPGKPDIDT